MARVAAFSIGGIDMWIPSGDHAPPHFHARRPEWYAKVFIEQADSNMIRLIRPPNGKIRGRDRKAIVEGVNETRRALLIEWEMCQGIT